jgi:hypothetical protein
MFANSTFTTPPDTSPTMLFALLYGGFGAI